MKSVCLGSLSSEGFGDPVEETPQAPEEPAYVKELREELKELTRRVDSLERFQFGGNSDDD